jgi:hypothetical protein
MTFFLAEVIVGVELIGAARHNAIVGNRIGGEPHRSGRDQQEVGVLLRRQASNNPITKNFLFKDIAALQVESENNTIENNAVVPR